MDFWLWWRFRLLRAAFIESTSDFDYVFHYFTGIVMVFTLIIVLFSLTFCLLSQSMSLTRNLLSAFDGDAGCFLGIIFV